jgi:hypothetical protein
MALYYDFYETPLPKGSDRKKTYHVRLVPSGISSTDDIIEEISSATTYTEADMKGAVQALTDFMKKELEDGCGSILQTTIISPLPSSDRS